MQRPGFTAGIFSAQLPIRRREHQARCWFDASFVETRRGTFFVMGRSAWHLEDDERREFSARVEEIIDKARVLQRWTLAALLIAAPLLMVGVPQIFARVPHFDPDLARVTGIWAVMGSLLVTTIPDRLQWLQLRGLRNRLARRVASRESWPAAFILDRRPINWWSRSAQALAILAFAVAMVAVAMSYPALRPAFAVLGLPSSTAGSLMPISGPALLAGAAAWVLFLIGQIFARVEKRREQRLRDDRELAKAWDDFGDDVLRRRGLR